jgi:hypothetical protein
MVAALGVASIITGVLAAYTSIYLGLVQYDPSLFYYVYIPIIVWGVLSGSLGGVIASRLWERNLKERFSPLQVSVSQASQS